jgi:UTP--glucose-1-phosphate uridylyltransferase
MPKEMLTVVDRPLIQYAVDEARAAGIEQFCMVSGRGKTALIDHFDVSYELEATLRERGKHEALADLERDRLQPGAITTVRQQEPLGLGHAIWCARTFIGDDPFAILLPDDLVLSKTPCMAQLARAYQETGGSVVAVVEVPRDQTNRYGILKIGEDDGRLVEVTGLIEKPKPEVAPSNLSIIGRYILMPEVIGHLSRMERGAGNEVQLTDAIHPSTACASRESDSIAAIRWASWKPRSPLVWRGRISPATCGPSSRNTPDDNFDRTPDALLP